jgi:hypothetical protein
MSATGHGFGDVVGGVQLGVQTSSFRDLRPKAGDDGVDTLIQAMTACDVRDCELAAPLVEAAYGGSASAHHAEISAMTPQMMRRELRKWRLRTPMAYFATIGARFEHAGITVSAYNYSPDSTFTDEEIDRGFSAAKALGATIMTTSMTPAIAKRVAPFADTHRMVVALPAQLAAAALSMSPFFRINLDVGPSTADNLDPVAFIRDHHTEIISLHLKDCRGNGGDALRLLKRERWPIHVYLEHESRGAGTAVEEVKRCLAYAKQALA